MEDVKMFYLRGRSGKHYRFYSFQSLGHFKKAGGVYIVANRQEEDNKVKHEVLDIGETDDLSTLNENILTRVDLKGPGNCVCARIEVDPSKRRNAISDLRQGLIVNFTGSET